MCIGAGTMCSPLVLFLLLLRLQLSFLTLVIVIVLVDLGNKLGIGQDKDVSRSSMLFAEIDLMFLNHFTY